MFCKAAHLVPVLPAGIFQDLEEPQLFIPMMTTQKIQIYYCFEFPTRHPYKICWFEFWVRRPKRLALVAATAARFRGGGGRGGGDHGRGRPGRRMPSWRRRRCGGFRGRSGGGNRGGCRTDVQMMIIPFIVLTETKFRV
jgi:hypothetical protein